MRRVGRSKSLTAATPVYRTDNINYQKLYPDITEGMSGTGYVDDLLSKRPKVLNDFLELEGDSVITSLEVCRKPLNSVYKRLLNALTFGQAVKKMKAMGYDNLFHLYLVIYLDNGNVYSLEKNQRVNVKEGRINGECQPVMVYGKKTVEQFIVGVEDLNIPGFYRYDTFSDNCQKWIYDLLNNNGINEYNDFIMQDLDTLAPYVLKRVAKGITDVVALGDYALRGGGCGPSCSEIDMKGSGRLKKLGVAIGTAGAIGVGGLASLGLAGYQASKHFPTMT